MSKPGLNDTIGQMRMSVQLQRATLVLTAHAMRLGFVCLISARGTVGNRPLRWLDFWSGVVLCTRSSGTIKHSVKGHLRTDAQTTLRFGNWSLECQHASEIQILKRGSQTYPRVRLELISFSSWFFPLYVNTIIWSLFKNSNFLKWNEKALLCRDGLLWGALQVVCRTHRVLILSSPWAQFWH